MKKYYLQGLPHNNFFSISYLIWVLGNACPVNLPTTSSPASVMAFFKGRVKSLMN